MTVGRRDRRALGLGLACALALVGLAAPTSVRAELLPCTVIEVVPIDEEGATRSELSCDLDARGVLGDRVTIVSRGATGSAGTWPGVADTTDATWIFDYQSDSEPELVIRFHRAGSTAVAELYDAREKVRWLEHTVVGSAVMLRNDPPPTVRVVAPEGWWQPDGRVNFNLDISVDGLLDAAFDMRAKLRGHVETDGTVDFTIRIADENGNGRPDYDWRTVRHPESQPRALQLTFLTVNVRDDEPPLEPMWPWPYLGPVTYGYLTSAAHSTSQPPIQMDWANGTLMAVGELVSSRGNDGQWFVYSYEQLGAGLPNRANFENPFAWYDLAGDRDGTPELSIRLVYYDPLEPLFVRGNHASPMNVVRYSWDQNNDDTWDYKLGLLGTHEIRSTVRVGGADIATIPYDEFPRWVTDQPWAVATFVAAEGVRARGEGVYVWDPSTWLTERYFTGFADSPWPPDDAPAERAEDQHDLNNVPPGYRGEYQLNLGRPVRLYLSSIDGKLHLVNAAQGSWNVDEQTEIRYADSDGDGYIDDWQSIRDGELEERLNHSGAYLVYTSAETVIVKRVDVPPALWEGPPPSDTAGWRELRETLEPYLPDLRLAPRERLLAQIDLRRTAERIDGSTQIVERGSAHDFRPDGDGFRFVLDLQPGHRVAGERLMPLDGESTGRLLVTSGSQFSIRPATPANLALAVDIPDRAQLRPSLPAQVSLIASNSGLEDAVDLLLVGEATNGSRRVEFGRQELSLLAGETLERDLTWQAGAAGEWHIEVRLEGLDGTVRERVSEKVTVGVSEGTAAGAIAVASSSSGARLAAFVLLAMVAVVTGLAALHASRPPRATLE